MAVNLQAAQPQLRQHNTLECHCLQLRLRLRRQFGELGGILMVGGIMMVGVLGGILILGGIGGILIVGGIQKSKKLLC